MSAAVAVQSGEKKKAKSPAPAAAEPAVLQPRVSAGAMAVLPIFLHAAGCACGGTCDDCMAQRSPWMGAPSGGSEDFVLQAMGASQGEPLKPATRHQMEGQFGHDFSTVSVHHGDSAAAAAKTLGANAFATGNDIYFAAGQYQPETPEGAHLLAHELTHTVQQSKGQVPASAVSASSNGLAIAPTNSPLEPDAERTADRVVRGENAGPSASAPASGIVQREEEKSLTQRAEDAVASGVEWAVRKVSPDLADLVGEGPMAWLERKITAVLDQAIPGLWAGIDPAGAIQSVSTFFSGIVGAIKGLFTGGAKTCGAFAAMMGALRKLANKVLESEAIAKAKQILLAVNDAVGTIYKLVLAPQFEALSTILGGVWSVIKAIGSTVSGWISKAKDAVSGAWTWIKGKLGLDGDDPDSVWSWIKGKASTIWAGIRDKLAVAAAPLSTTAKVIALLSPMGPVLLLIDKGPEVVKAVQWLWDHRDDKDLIRNAHAQMKDTFLPGLLDAGASFQNAMQKAFDWIGDQIGAAAAAFLSVAGALTGLPVLSSAKSLFDSAKVKLEEFSGWAKSGLKSAWEWVKGVVKGIGDFIAPYKEILSSIGMAILNPAMIPLILGGWVWRKLDSCIKKPIIEFFFDIVVKALATFPDLPFLGPLWVILKHGALGFLRTLAAAPYEKKEIIVDKVAKILSGASFDFIAGFVTGFLEGIWDGIKDPFKAILSVIDALHWVEDFLSGLVVEALGIPKQKQVQEVSAPGSAAPAPAGSKLSPEVKAQLGASAGAVLADIGPDIDTVKSGFWEAAKEYFSGGKGVTFDDLTKKLGSAWRTMLGFLQEAGAELGVKFIIWFTGGMAEGEIGNKLGWASGSILFQVALDYISAGTWLAAYPLITTIAKFLNWPMEALGVVFKALARVGKYVMEGVKSLGGMVREAAKGALKAVGEAIGHIGEKLVRWAEEMIGKFGGATEREAGSLAEKETAGTAAKEAGKLGERGLEKAAAELEEGIVVAEPSAVAGHQVKITEGGLIIRCSPTCQQLGLKYDFILERQPGLAERLADLETKAAAATDKAAASRVARQVAQLEADIIDAGIREAEGVLGKVTDEAGLRAFIEEHPEELAAALERHSVRLEAEGAEGGAKRLENAASHEGGLASETYAKLRGKTPSGEIKSYVNLGKTPPYPDPALPGRMVTGALHADHIVPMKRITEMPGFLDLREDQMLQVLNYKKNFVGLSEAANTSKGEKTFYDWLAHSGSGTAVDTAFRRQMMREELELELELEQYIQSLLHQ